ncbi:MAG: hypothetical protein K8R88_04670 [Armatimonadetes bacterium]|nr:hypothetical protein [Armatimonadota bacterium]
MSDKLFSETEVGQVMRRAAELQELGSTAGYVPGVTSTELIRIAKEIGIDRKFLDLAIQENHNPPSSTKKKVRFPEIERIYPIEIEAENFDVITEYIKPHASTGQPGVSGGPGVSQLGRTLQGQAATSWASPTFRVSSRDGRTRVVVSSDEGTPVGLTCLWILPLIFTIALFKLSIAAGMIGVLTCFLLGYFSYLFFARKSAEMTVKTADDLERAILEYQASRSAQMLSGATMVVKEVEPENQVHVESGL